MAQDLLPADSWTDGIEQPDAIVNDNARRLEVSDYPALSFEATQPGAPAEGDLYVLSGTWGSEVAGTLAYYFDGAWTYWTPFEGQLKEIGGATYRYTTGAWALYVPGSFAPPAFQYVADTGSTADSAPGAGLMKWNHATQASATVLYFDDLTDDAVSLTGLWSQLTAGGFVRLQHATDPDTWQEWKITAVVDATGYAKLSVTLVADGGAFADGDPMLVTIDQGADTAALDTRGKQAIYVSAPGMRPSVVAGAAALANIASASNMPDITTLDFDPSTIENAQFGVVMPEKWDGGTLTFRFHWSHAATTTNFGVAFGLAAVAVGDSDTIAAAYGTRVDVVDTGGTTDDLYISDESAAITVAGSPAGGKMVFFRLSRRVSDAGDTMAIDARIHGLTVYCTTDASTDA